jgi:DNA-binding response OmpR family regulator
MMDMTYNRALIIEDREEVRDVLVIMTDHFGFKFIEEASSVERAMTLFEPDRYQLILIDISLGKDANGLLDEGFYLSKYFRNMDAKVCIIGLTAYRDLFEKGKVIDAGLNDIFMKPFDYEDILTVIRENLK